MSTQPEKLNTSETQLAAHYQAARGITVVRAVDTTQRATSGRTVTTTAKEGSIGLRYAPRNPGNVDISTVY